MYYYKIIIMTRYSDYIITYIIAICSLVLTVIDLWIYVKDSQGLIDSSNCSTSPLNTFFTYSLVTFSLCMLGLWLVVWESRRNVQSWICHVIIGLIWVNCLVCASMGVDWHNRASYGQNCNTSYKTTVVLFVNFAYLFVVQTFIATCGFLGIGTHFSGLDPITETSVTNSYASRNIRGQRENNRRDRRENIEIGVNDLVRDNL